MTPTQTWNTNDLVRPMDFEGTTCTVRSVRWDADRNTFVCRLSVVTQGADDPAVDESYDYDQDELESAE